LTGEDKDAREGRRRTRSGRGLRGSNKILSGCDEQKNRGEGVNKNSHVEKPEAAPGRSPRSGRGPGKIKERGGGGKQPHQKAASLKH